MIMGKSSIYRQIFFDTTVHIQAIKDTISGKNEEEVIRTLITVGFQLGVDFKRQYPIGNRFVIDLAFVNEQVAVEVDGNDHQRKNHKVIDKKRDRFLRENNWVPIRIKDKEFFGYKQLFYKYLIKDVVLERRTQFQSGKLFPIEIPDFNDD